MKIKIAVITILALSFAILGCAGNSPINSTLEITPPNSVLAGTDWQLVSFHSMDDSVGIIRPESKHIYTMRLNTDGSVNLRLNCNRAMGSWTAQASGQPESGSFSFSPLAGTRALCPPPSLDQKILIDFTYVRSYLLKNGKLHLSLIADAGIYIWEKIAPKAAAISVPKSPEAGGPRNWKVVAESGLAKLYEQPDINSQVALTYKVGTILDNLGCQANGSEVWCDVQQLGGGPRGFVFASNLKPAISPNGSVLTGPDDSALRAAEGKFDASGPIPCAWQQEQPMTQCEMQVARAGGGYATVVISKPEGRTRTIYFRMGQAIGADTSQADGYPVFKASRKGDLTLITVGNERYEIPDAVILGG